MKINGENTKVTDWVRTPEMPLRKPSGLFMSNGIIALMSDYHFYHPIEVRYGDLDPQGHVNNAKHLTFFEQARIAYLIELGLFTKDQSFMEIGVILADVHITYFEPVYFGQVIKVGVQISRLGNKSMTWEQSIVDADTDKELAKGEIIMVAYDYNEERTISIPQNWREKINHFEGLKG
jgi:acyl-CoA thioester hydrolase